MSTSQTNSTSFSWDNSGEELAHAKGDELSKINAMQAKSLYEGDIGATLAQRRRIKDLQQYINAYKFGGPAGPYPGVYAGKRTGSQSSSQSVSASERSE
jgi:hypothetical protein